jgi:hypothetical protein
MNFRIETRVAHALLRVASPFLAAHGNIKDH